MDLLGIIMTMKGDSALQETSFAAKTFLKVTSRLIQSPLFTEKETTFLQNVLSTNSLNDWTHFSDYLIQAYNLPVLALKN